mgnify:CR=1 FL=1
MFAKYFNISIKAFQQKRRKLGLLRPANENKSRFKKGHKSKFINTKPKQTSFKKGHQPHNTKPLGSTRDRKDGYVEIKTEKGFKLLQRVLWEEYFSEIPKGHIITFKDQNKRNFELKNLLCISKEENLNRNRNIEKQRQTIKKTWDFAKKVTAKGTPVKIGRAHV